MVVDRDTDDFDLIEASVIFSVPVLLIAVGTTVDKDAPPPTSRSVPFCNDRVPLFSMPVTDSQDE